VSDCKSIYIFGYSGHAYVVIDSMLTLGYKIKGYFDKVEAQYNPYEIAYLGSEDDIDLKKIVSEDFVFPTVGDNAIRIRLVKKFNDCGLRQLLIQDPTALVTQKAVIGNSTYIGKGSIVNAETQIGHGVIINSGAIIEHECRIQDGSHIAPGATLCGNVIVGNNCFVGANSVIRQNIRVSNDVYLGAGSVLISDVFESGTWFGNPAKCLK